MERSQGRERDTTGRVGRGRGGRGGRGRDRSRGREEQFYLVYPALFVALAVLGRKASFRVRLGIGLVVVIAASFTLSVLQTSSDPTVAYFSPFTRAWELALGALVAVATPWLLARPESAERGGDVVRFGGDRLLGGRLRRRHRLPRLPRGHSGPRGRAGHRRGDGRPDVGGRVGPRAPTVPLDGEDLLCALPVALADPDHRQWRLVDLWKGSCPVDSLQYKVPPGWGKPGTPWLACEQWQQWALSRINTLKPNLLILTQEGRLNQVSKPFTFQQWEQGLATTFHRIHIPKSRVVVLGNIPFLPDSPPECLARHSSNIQACSGPLDTYLTGYNQVEEQEAHSVGARYINVVPWFCSTVCTGVVGHYEVYFDTQPQDEPDGVEPDREDTSTARKRTRSRPPTPTPTGRARPNATDAPPARRLRSLPLYCSCSHSRTLSRPHEEARPWPMTQSPFRP